MAALVLPSTASAAKLRSGTVRLAFDNAFGVALVKSGVTPTVVAPATQDSVTFRLPVFTGRSAARKSFVRTHGGFLLTNQQTTTSIRLTGLSVVLRGKKVSLRGLAALDGRTYDTFEFATGRARSVLRTATDLVASDITLRLSDIGATSLNSQFSGVQFTAGTTIGTARVSAGSGAR